MKLLTSALLAVLLAACGGTEPMPFQTTDTAAGGGAEATSGRRVVVHYTGWLYEPSAADKKGAKFDSSRDRNEPFTFVLGRREVIDGWDEGIKGMRVGGRRKLTIPTGLAYGADPPGRVIPPHAALKFDVELLAVE
jgi:FKBP-type peptidyl-prolyl cis-trans isomerase FkpA